MRRGVLPTIRPLNVNLLHGSEKPRHGKKKLRFQKSRVKTMLVIFFDWQGVIHKEFVPEGETINAVYYKGVIESLLNGIRRVRPGMCESGDWFLLHDKAPSHETIVKQFLAQRKVTVLDHPPYSPDLAPADYFLFPKVKSHLKGRLFDSISDIEKAVTSTLDTMATGIGICPN